MIISSEVLVFALLVLASQIQGYVGRSAHGKDNKSVPISKEVPRSAVVPINIQDLQSKSDEGIVASRKSETELQKLEEQLGIKSQNGEDKKLVTDFIQGIDRSKGDLTTDVMQKMGALDGFSPITDLKQDLNTMKAGNVRNDYLSRLNPLDTTSPYNSNSDQNQDKYNYDKDPLPEYSIQDKAYGINVQADHQDGEHSESYGGIDELRDRYKSNGAETDNLLRNSDLVSEISKHVLLRLLERNKSSADDNDKHVLLEKLLGLHPEIKGFSSEEISASKVALQATPAHQKNVTQAPELNTDAAATAGKMAGKVTLDGAEESVNNQGKTTPVGLRQSNEHQSGTEEASSAKPTSQVEIKTEQAKADSRHSAPNIDEEQVQPQSIRPNLEIEENTNTKSNTDSFTQDKSSPEGVRGGDRLVTLKISGAGKPVSFKADTSNDGSLLLKIPGNVKLMDTKIDKESADQPESRSSQVDSHVTSKSNGVLPNNESKTVESTTNQVDKNHSGSKPTSPVTNTSNGVSPVNEPKTGASTANQEDKSHSGLKPTSPVTHKSTVNPPANASHLQSADPKEPPPGDTSKPTKKLPETSLEISGSSNTMSLLSKQLKGHSDWQILGKTNINLHAPPALPGRSEEDVYRHSLLDSPLLDDNQDDDGKSLEGNSERGQKSDDLDNSQDRGSKSYLSRKKIMNSYPTTILAVNEPLTSAQPLRAYLPPAVLEQGHLSNRLNSALADTNPLPAYLHSAPETSPFTRSANGITQPSNKNPIKMDILRLVAMAQNKMAELRQRQLNSRSQQHGFSAPEGQSGNMPLGMVLRPSEYMEESGMVRGMSRSQATDGGKRYDIGDSSRGFSIHTDKWSAWSPCSATCGQGIQARARLCEGTGCQGYHTQSKTCMKDTCPEELVRAGLRLHNKFRAWHKSPPLEWSKKLAKKAQTIADDLASQKNLLASALEDTPGESIAQLKHNYDIAAEKATAQWYSEVKSFSFKEPQLKDNTRHFTQLVWKDSKNLGMGAAKSRDGGHTIVVALYDPPGNVPSKMNDNVRMPEESSKRDVIFFQNT